MGDCELLRDCMFFNDRLKNMPVFSERLKEEFCRGDYSKCARYLVAKALGRDKVPDNLFPNQSERVADLLNGKAT